MPVLTLSLADFACVLDVTSGERRSGLGKFGDLMERYDLKNQRQTV
jgi:hypothetical protein